MFRVALAKQPEARFASVSVFAEALRQALRLQSSGGITAIDAPTIVRTPSPPAGSDIHTSLAISMAEALTGTRRTLNFPDGRQISVAVPAGVYNGQLLRLEGLGHSSPYGEPAGALLLSIAITPTETIPAITNPEKLLQTIAIAPSPPPPPPLPGASSSSRKRQGFPTSMVILLVVLALLVGLVGGAFLYFSRLNSSNTNQGNLPSHPQNTVTTGVTPAHQGNTTATAQISPSVSASSNPYANSGTLVLNDPLTGNNYNWVTGTNNHNASCQFTTQGLDVTQPAQGFFHGCIAQNTHFSNFVYEVRVNMISGDYAGITFCADKAQGTYYFFYIKPDGHYVLEIFRGDQPQGTLTSSSSSAIITGLPSTNLLAVVVQNGNISLYVNETNIANANDATYTQGQIGVFSGNDVNSAEAVFSNARVWQL